MSQSPLLRLAAAASLLALAGCGSVGDLRPPEGKSLPVKPLMARTTPTPEELLTPPSYANPARVDELMRRSVPRQSDRFDLPPPSGLAPVPPAETEQRDEDSEGGNDPTKPGAA